MKLQGPARALLGASPTGGSVDLAVPTGTTVGELLGQLADCWGERFREAVGAAASELPARLRIFIDGEQAASAAQTLPARGDAPLRVLVVILAPMMGGVG